MAKRKSQITRPKIKLKADKPSRVKAAIRKWVESGEKASSNMFDLDNAPAWAENALAEVVKTVMPSRRMPTSGEWDLELLGELLGRQQAFAKMFSGEVAMGSETRAEYEELEKLAASLPHSPERDVEVKAAVADLQNMMKATDAAIPDFLRSALSSSHQDTLKFQRGLMRGMSLPPDQLITGKTFQRHTRTFWLLGVRWHEFASCRSVAEVHRRLCRILGERQVGDLKTFQNRVAKPIGLKLSASGRPRNAE